MLAEKAVIIIAILFVPLATEGGNPKKIKRGNVISDPPPAIVLITPTKKPTNTNKGYSQGKDVIKSIFQI